MLCTQNDTWNCQVRDTKSTTRCSWSISYDVIRDTRYGTARYVIRNQPHDVHDRSHMMWYVYHELLGMYVVRNQAETAENAESTSKHQRIQQYAIFHFMFWRRNDIYTMNCQVCDTNWSISSRRCQKHERTSTWYYASARRRYSHIPSISVSVQFF